MNSSADSRVLYDHQDRVYIVDLSGKMDERTLAEISAELRDSMRANAESGKAVKFLFDFRTVQWDSEATHHKARAISAGYLEEFRGLPYFSAIVNERREGRSADNEFFFTKKQDALGWLREK